MKAVILGAGYGTRLQDDLSHETSQKYSSLKGVSKPLLPCGNLTIADRLINFINADNLISRIYIVTNSTHYPQFVSWAEKSGFPIYGLINDGTTSNENRLGAVADLSLAIHQTETDEDILVVAGDTLFYPDLNISSIINYFKQKNGSVVARYTVDDNEVHKRGIGVFNSNDQLVSVMEKPKPTETLSRWAIPPLYIYQKDVIPLIDQFLSEKKDRPLTERDALGLFLSWLCSRKNIYGYSISGRFDVGRLKDYNNTLSFFKN